MPQDPITYTGHLAGLFARLAAEALTDDVLRRAGGEGVTPALLSVLECLRRRGACTVREVAHGLGVSDAAGSQLVGRLEARRLVLRREDAHDRRRSSLALTPRGEQLVRRVEAARAERLQRILGGMDPESRGALVRGLEAFVLSTVDDPETLAQLCGRCRIPHSPDCVVNRAAVALTGREVGQEWISEPE